MGGGSPQIPHAEQRRRYSYRSLERILCVLGLCLVSHAVWAIVLFDKMRLRPPGFFLSRQRRGTSSVRVGAAGAPVAIRRDSRFIASNVAVGRAQTADGLPRGSSPSVTMPRQVGSTPQIQFNPTIQKISLDSFCFLRLNRP